MADIASVKTCRICGKDLTGQKRVKDGKGQYHCEPCYQAAAARTNALKAAAVPPPAPQEPADEYDLRPQSPAPNPRVRPASVPIARAPVKKAAPTLVIPSDDEGSRKQILPKNCPNCGHAMLPGRRICIKCNRDVTRMDKLLAMRAGDELPPEKAEVIAGIVGRVMKYTLILVVVGVVVFLAWGAWLMFTPAGPFDEYPKTRNAAVSEFLGYIAKGTEKSYHNAFLLVSFRVRSTNNAQEEQLYRGRFIRMHDDFLKKYGADWPSRAKIENMSPADTTGDAIFEISIGPDAYHIETQVQIPFDEATLNVLSRKAPYYVEDGQKHWGILDVSEYSVNATRHDAGAGPLDVTHHMERRPAPEPVIDNDD
jgi:hypothetical protein